ncbi:PAS domain-containing protein [Hymenobacter sp. BT635]|uniref:histidine kinase n=1 Tax=Hymenobacter nitidus TaxID=2880929 RepID=A0ABS8AB52_9BACT|nr:PAS domain-containing protein [Hymenobacter nitidus]MCB2377612.1 PAS domain-containing protein [Hymenobacter nitidus]
MHLSSELSAVFPPEALLLSLLENSLNGIILAYPVVAEPGSDDIVDLSRLQLNPAAQRMLDLPAQPSESFLHYLPGSLPSGVFDFYRRTFQSGEAGHHEFLYQADGLDNYFEVTAQRVGDGLLIIFTDTVNQRRTNAELALRESQAREKAARAEAELQRQQLHSILMQAPAMIALFEGPDHIFRLVNPQYQQLVGSREILDKPIRQAMPELVGQPIFELLDWVYRSGHTYYATEMLVQLDHANSGTLGNRYYNFVYQALRNLSGAIDGILVFAYEVTDQVVARQQTEQSRQQVTDANQELATANEELAAANEEMQAANEEIRANNEELFRAQDSLQQLNQELENRVAMRTEQVQQAQTEAERQKARLEQFFMQAPAAICILDGPALVFELVNPGYQQLFPGRRLQNKSIWEALPELVGSPVQELLERVYATGETVQGKEVPAPAARHEGMPPEDMYFNFTYQARFDEQGNIDGVLVFAYEVTEQVLARQRVAQANTGLTSANDELHTTNVQLARINVDLDNFIYTASHDLKAPIANIEGLLRVLLEELNMPPAHTAAQVGPIISMMQDSVERFKNTIDHLTEVTKLQKENEQPAAMVSVEEVLREVTLDLQPAIQESGADLSIEVETCPAVPFSRKNLRSVVYNLLSNALKYRDPARPLRVRIHCQPEGSAVMLRVQDNGLGLDLTPDRPLFGMFRRFHDHVEGSGIGLYMVKKILDNAGGTISVESKAGVGSTFTVYFKQ